VLAEWIHLKKTFAKFQGEGSKETSDDKSSDDMTSKAKRKRNRQEIARSPADRDKDLLQMPTEKAASLRDV